MAKLFEKVSNSIDKRIKVIDNKIIDQQKFKSDITFDNLIKNIAFEKNKKSYFKEEPIKIAFLFQIASFWPSWESVYYSAIKNKKLKVKFFLLKEINKEPSQMKSAESFLIKNKIKYTYYTEETIEDFDPHIVVMQTPYDDWHRSDSSNSEYFLKKGIRMVYIPYGIEISETIESIKLQYDNDFIRNMWKVYIINDAIKSEYIKYSKSIHNAFVVTGHPKFDGLFYKKCLTKYNFKKLYPDKKIITLKVHFKRKMDVDGATFKTVTPDEKIYLKFLKKYSKNSKYLIIFTPHPKFYDFMDDKIKNEFLNILENSKNIINFISNDYREALYSADMIICDRSALLIESAAMDVPVLYVYNKDYKEPLTSSLIPLIDSYYQGYNLQHINNFIKMASSNIDLMRNKRLKSFKKIVYNYDGKSGDRIIKDIINTIENEAIPRKNK